MLQDFVVLIFLYYHYNCIYFLHKHCSPCVNAASVRFVTLIIQKSDSSDELFVRSETVSAIFRNSSIDASVQEAQVMQRTGSARFCESSGRFSVQGGILGHHLL